jgi:hypothetical protein
MYLIQSTYTCFPSLLLMRQPVCRFPVVQLAPQLKSNSEQLMATGTEGFGLVYRPWQGQEDVSR